VESFVREHSLFLAFWAAVILLGAIESLAPQLPGDADRRRRWFTNFGLGLLNGLIVSAIPAATVTAALWAQESNFGMLNLFGVPWWPALVATVLARSLAQYVFHFLNHKVPLLWRLHRVHHSDVHLDVSSAFRNHPLEVILHANVFAHANLKISRRIEGLLRLLFVTPSLHRLHHSPVQIETDSNYGTILSIWDRACGTYLGETIQPGPALRFGLDEVSRDRASDLQAQLALPWRR
jgi:sterol desaturase/sphingolipid hydroxylase (fatty acid hydroxylase superfamily)